VPRSYLEGNPRYNVVERIGPESSDQEISVTAEKLRVVLSSRRKEARDQFRSRRN
jgi:hypothetical protein